jgi:hypothetical protein
MGNWDKKRLYVEEFDDEIQNVIDSVGSRFGYPRSRANRLALEFAAKNEDDFRAYVKQFNESE